MKFIHKMESVLIVITTTLCSLLLLNLFIKLRFVLPWRVNCWFCNNNFWIKFQIRNSWICPNCEQYNGFTQDGDYNKPILTNSEQAQQTPKLFQKSPPKNGLCKMCNINQQLKVAQLANFVPMNDKNFDNEIGVYRSQLEKAYTLCSLCKKVLQRKLHKEKETLLGSKLIQKRTPEKKNLREEKRNQKITSTINNISIYIAGILLVLVSIECCKGIIIDKNLLKTINNLKDLIISFLERLASILKMKMFMTFPILENYFNYGNEVLFVNLMPKGFVISNEMMNHINGLTQRALGGFVCLLQIIGHVWNINKLKYSILIDLLWSVFIITTIAHQSIAIASIVISLAKFASVSTVLIIYRYMNQKTARITVKAQPFTKMKNLSTGPINKLTNEDDDTPLETDDDVSLSKFGLNNSTDSSVDSVSQANLSLISGRRFTPRSSDNIWCKPINSTFCVNSVTCNSPSSISDTLFVKPTFKNYQKISKSDSDSELDESISSLCIGSPRKANMNKNNPIFSLRKFTASPNFITPAPLTRRPLISPSKLGHSTSWVAGGYWGSESDRQMFNLNSSRSSSQSSGFESQTSSINQRNIFSHPSSREESVYGEPPSILLDRFQHCNRFNSMQSPPNFSHIGSPVFPQMQYNNHVHIPQLRPMQQNHIGQTVYTPHPQYIQTSMFKSPNDYSLLKPQISSFPS